MLAHALDTEADDYEGTLFMHGACRHPGDVLPKPSSDGVVHVHWSEPQASPPWYRWPCSGSP
eukprot:9347335-Pyramimonas_sp.AAC.1